MVACSAVGFKIVTFSLTHTHSQEQRAATKENVERRMARTADELLEEEEGEEEPEEEESDDEVPCEVDRVHKHMHLISITEVCRLVVQWKWLIGSTSQGSD